MEQEFKFNDKGNLEFEIPEGYKVVSLKSGKIILKRKGFKDGDILVNNGVIFMYKCLQKEQEHNYGGWDNAIVYHCYLNTNIDELGIKENIGVGLCGDEGIRYAKREERTKLLDALKEKGYEFDFDTKTLKYKGYKDGDILVGVNIGTIFIYKCLQKEQEHGYGGSDDAIVYHCCLNTNVNELLTKEDIGVGVKGINEYRYATRDELLKLLDALKEKGYEFDFDTKTLKRTKLVPGGIYKSAGGCLYAYKCTAAETHKYDDCIRDTYRKEDIVVYHCCVYPEVRMLETKEGIGVGRIADATPATEEEQKLFFDVIAEKGYKWSIIRYELVPDGWRYQEGAPIQGYWITPDANIEFIPTKPYYKDDSDVFAKEKQAKSALAFAQISQIIANDRRFGGPVTNEEWNDDSVYKYTIERQNNSLLLLSFTVSSVWTALAFHKEEQRDLFLKEYEALVKQYFMIEE